MSAITWTNEQRRLGDLIPWEGNPRQIKAEKFWSNGKPVLPDNAICAHCGKSFYLKESSLRRGRGKYCSQQCQRDAGSVTKTCEVCGKEFKMKRSHDINGNGRYCSIACRSKGYIAREVFKGENSPRFIDGNAGSQEYERRAAHRRRARKRKNGGDYTLDEWNNLCEKYGNRCLACGRTDVLLTVDHIVPLKLGGKNDISNLQPLCKSCNCKKHTKVIDYREAISQEPA
jgi:5-methylcytosine-specific restriction endonuclease McrA